MSDPVAAAIDQVCDQILKNFVPPVSTIQAVRRFNGCMAILLRRHGLAITAEGIVFSPTETKGPAVVEDPELA
jgi:hypothetical protein